MSDSDIELVLAGYAAYERGDIDAAVAGLAPDVVWVEPEQFPLGGRRDGRAAVAEYLRASRAGWRALASTPAAERRGDRIVVVHHVRGTRADGTAHEATVADVYTVRDGQVVEMRAYPDPRDVPG